MSRRSGSRAGTESGIQPRKTCALALRAHRVRCLGTNGEDFVFASEANTPITSENVAHRILRPSCVRLGLRSIGWRVLRHTYATWLSESGAAIRATQDILGQSDLEARLRVYTHSVPDSKRRALANVPYLLFPSLPSRERRQEKQRESLARLKVKQVLWRSKCAPQLHAQSRPPTPT